MTSKALLVVAFAALLVPAPAAQSNGNPAIDVSLGALDSLQILGRTGSFPNGTNGFAMATTSCNKGSVDVDWLKAMDPNHPMISFLLARDDGVRMEQISDRSWVKHGFFALTQSLCDTCQGGDPLNGTFLGVGCSDTYTTSTNGDRVSLGPPDEIDPWLGDWNPVCSFFDRGDPPAAPPLDCDGVMSFNFIQAFQYGPTEHRVVVDDAALIDNGPESFYYQAQYTVRTEVESERGNNLGWREFAPSWNGFGWNLPVQSLLAHGSVLDGWSGASVTSNTNGGDDGRLYVAVKVTGPVDGFYHYEYAVHNRDNSRAVDALRIPACADAQVLNAGFHDVDTALADWSFTRNPSELVWSTTTNPLEWNTIYNFWFDSDAAPIDGVGVVLDAFRPGPGAGSVTVSTRAPTGLFNVDLGPGCSDGTPPSLFAVGSPARATLGNGTFGLQSKGNTPFTLVAFLFTPIGASIDVGGGCFSYVALQFLKVKLRGTNASGVASMSLPIPGDPSLEGVDVSFQLMEFDPLGGPFADDYDLSNGQRVRIGDGIPSCP
jgi:hypothetical protein